MSLPYPKVAKCLFYALLIVHSRIVIAGMDDIPFSQIELTQRPFVAMCADCHSPSQNDAKAAAHDIG